MTDRPEFSDVEPDDDRDAALREFWEWMTAQDGEPEILFVEPRPVDTVDPGDFL